MNHLKAAIKTLGAIQRKKNNEGPPDFDEFLKGISGLFGRGKGKKGSSQNGGGGLILLVVIILGLGYLGANSAYSVDQQEQGVVLRLGKFNPESIAEPGLNFKIPFIDSVELVNVTAIQRVAVSKDSLTSDNNVISVDIEIQYRTNNAADWVLNVQNPRTLLSLLAESAQRHVVGGTDMDTLMTDGRALFAQEVKERLQFDLKQYAIGVEIAQVNVLDVDPPNEVKDAYADVLRAREERVQLNNEAERYESKIIPEAEGQAAKMKQESLAYKNRLIEEAKGEAQRFDSLYAQYVLAPEVTRQRLYLETIEKVYAESSKVIVGTSDSNSMMYLPLDQLMKKAKQQVK